MPDSLKFKSTAEIPVPERIIDQVVGQEASVELIKKAAAQKRNVLLVGLPGTGKSMLAQAMAEILPISKLQDVLIYPNNADSNNPRVVIVAAGEGQKILANARIEAQREDDGTRMFGLILPLGWMIFSYAIWAMKWISDIIYAATLIVGVFLLIGFNLGSQLRTREAVKTPKLLVDNSGKKIAPFFEGTGARAGALLGDVRHDPLQSSIDENKFVVCLGGVEKKVSFEQLWLQFSQKYPDLVEKHDKGYEAFVFPKDEMVFTYGINDKKEVVKTRIFSMNRRPYNDKVIEISDSSSSITLTPEHEVIMFNGDKNAEKVSKNDGLIKLAKVEIATIAST